MIDLQANQQWYCRHLVGGAAPYTLGAVLLAALLVAPAAAQPDEAADSAPVLELRGAGEQIEPGAPIEISTGDAPPEVLDRISYEIDDLDVSGFAMRDPGVTTLALPVVLEPGTHLVRAIEQLPDGRLLERGVWTIEIRAPRFQGGELSGSIDLDATRRMADHHAEGAPERLQIRGAANLQGSLHGDDWEVQGYLPVLFDRSSGFASSGTLEQRDWDLGAYLFQGRKGPFGARVGHFSPDPPSLILEGFHRRGASASVEVVPLRSRLTAWSLRSEPITGFREGFGLQDRDRRVSGVTVQGQPVEIPGGVLDLAATYLRGRTGPGSIYAGVSERSIRLQESGTAWSLRADGSFFDSRLRLRGEYARTRYDPFVGISGSAKRDDAWSVLIGVAPWQNLVFLDYPVQIEAEVEFREIGRLFRSIANPGAPVDRFLQQVRLGSSWAGLQGSVLFGRERDNVEDLEFLPRFRTDIFDAQLSWSPRFRTPPESLWRKLLGQPYLQVGWTRERLKPVHSPSAEDVLGARILAREQTVITDDLGAVIQSFPGAAFLDPTAGLLGTAALVPANDFFDPFVGLPELVFSDRWFRTTAVAFGSSYNRGSWSLSHTVLRYEDNTRQDPDSRSDLSGLNGSLYLGSQASLSLSLQRQREKFEDLGFQRTTWLGSVNLNAQLVPEVLDGSFTASLTRSRNSYSTVDSRFTTLSGRLDWHAWQARPTRPGLTLSLFGTWTDLHDSVNRSLAVSSFQVFLQASIRWPVQL
ncbi:MAG: hypothetical protein GY723_11280 [bacterium]|nr:hypothetical protein [bacterium]